VVASGELAACGRPADIFTGDIFSNVYGVAVSIGYTPSGRAVIVPMHR
jgi:ABC-type cobalamin/Fe3+-siderophores transport system ATPase subunit